MKKSEKYDIKEASNQDLTASARKIIQRTLRLA